MGIACKGGGGKGFPGYFMALFSHVCPGVKGLARMVWGTFFHVCLFDKGVVYSNFGNAHPYRTSTFQKGASLRPKFVLETDPFWGAVAPFQLLVTLSSFA